MTFYSPDPRVYRTPELRKDVPTYPPYKPEPNAEVEELREQLFKAQNDAVYWREMHLRVSTQLDNAATPRVLGMAIVVTFISTVFLLLVVLAIIGATM